MITNNQEVGMKTLAEVRAAFVRKGVSIANWARQNNLSPQCVYDVRQGRNKCRRGEAHKAAVLLGIKNDENQQKSPAMVPPGQAPQEGTEMERQNTTRSFTPAQTLKAREIQKAALWVAERIDRGLNAEEAIILRDHLLSLAAQVENTEQFLFAVLFPERHIEILHRTSADFTASPIMHPGPHGGAA